MSDLDLLLMKQATIGHRDFALAALRRARSLEEFEPLASIVQHLNAVLEDLEEMREAGLL